MLLMVRIVWSQQTSTSGTILTVMMRENLFVNLMQNLVLLVNRV